MKRIGLLYHPLKEAAYNLAKEIQSFLEARDIANWLCSAWEGEKARTQANGSDLILSIGGDGTILRAVQAAAPYQTPVTGINLGTLGFMTELSAAEALDRLADLLAGKGWVDERAMLEAELFPADGKHETAQVFHALNDVVVTREAIARVVYVEASVDGELLTTYKSDGVIMATATGSTGYSLAAGGPILHAQAEEFLMLPLLPHLSSAYTMVLPSTSVVKLRLSTTHRAILSIDGHINLPMSTGDTVTIKHSPTRARFLRIHSETSFFGSLEQKLKGKQ